MKMRCKMLAMLMAVLMMFLCMVMPINAAIAEPDVEPLWDYTNNITLTLTFPDYGYAEASVFGKPGVTKITIDIYVYRQSGNSWIYVAEKHSTTYGMAAGLSCQFSAISGEYYRADYTFTVTKNNVAEIISKTQYDTCD